MVLPVIFHQADADDTKLNQSNKCGMACVNQDKATSVTLVTANWRVLVHPAAR